MSDALAALDRSTDAAQAATEALGILMPFVERYPQSYAGLARTIATGVVRYCEAAGRQPDMELLERAVAAISENVAAESPTTNALMAKIETILEAAQKSGTFDEAALAELPVEIADELRKFWTDAAR